MMTTWTRRQYAVALSLTIVATGLTPADAAPAPADPTATYDAFNRFCLGSFDAAQEPLAYERLGADLVELDGSRWMHASETSAAVGWSTNLPSSTVVEYGPTPKLGRSTTPPERPFHTHLHYLTDLKPGTTYHYRLITTGPTGARVEGPVETFKTEAPDKSVVRIDRLDGGKALVIDKPGRYLVTADLTADGTAFDIKAAGVTLDLGGRRVVYNAKPMEPIKGGDPNEWFAKAPHGVYVGDYNRKDIAILNGTITQGQGGDGAQENGRGANPIAAMSGITGEVAGVTLEWHGEQVSGFMMPYGPAVDLHHCVLTDRGSGLTNRHQGVAAIRSVPSPHHNLIKRTRQRGIDCVNDGDAYANEIYIDSQATNSTGIATYKTKNLAIRDNFVYGGGYLAIGIGALSDGTENVKITGNYVHLQSAAPSDASEEYGEQSGAYALRVTWGGVDIEAADNTFIAYGKEGGMVRGVWYCPDTKQSNNVIRDNVIKAVVQDDASDLRGAVVISGSEDSENAEPPLFLNNRIISNFCAVLLGEPYGKGCNAVFRNNTFERVGNLPRFRFVQIGYGNFLCTGVRFIDSTFENIDPGNVLWADSTDVERSFTLEKTVTATGKPGATVTVKDRTGATAAAGAIDADGTFAAPVVVDFYRNGEVQSKTPHTVVINEGGREKKDRVNLSTAE